MENRDAAAGTSQAKVSVAWGSRFPFPAPKEPARGAACPRGPALPIAYVAEAMSCPWLTYLISIHYTEQSRPIVQSRALVQRCQALGICAETLFGKKELQFG